MIQATAGLMDTESPESSETIPLTAGRDSSDCEVTVGSGAAPALVQTGPKGRAIAAHRTPAARAHTSHEPSRYSRSNDALMRRSFGVGQRRERRAAALPPRPRDPDPPSAEIVPDSYPSDSGGRPCGRGDRCQAKWSIDARWPVMRPWCRFPRRPRAARPAGISGHEVAAQVDLLRY